MCDYVYIVTDEQWSGQRAIMGVFTEEKDAETLYAHLVRKAGNPNSYSVDLHYMYDSIKDFREDWPETYYGY